MAYWTCATYHKTTYPDGFTFLGHNSLQLGWWHLLSTNWSSVWMEQINRWVLGPSIHKHYEWMYENTCTLLCNTSSNNDRYMNFYKHIYSMYFESLSAWSSTSSTSFISSSSATSMSSSLSQLQNNYVIWNYNTLSSKIKWCYTHQSSYVPKNYCHKYHLSDSKELLFSIVDAWCSCTLLYFPLI